MRIISKFHEYYDTMLKHGIDNTIVYTRHNKVYREHTPEYEYVDNILVELQKKAKKEYISIFHRWSSIGIGNYNTGVTSKILILFCGKVYPCLCITTDTEERKDIYCYNTQAVVSALATYYSKRDMANLKVSTGGYCWKGKKSTTIDRLDNFFNIKELSQDKADSIHHKVDSPVLFLAIRSRLEYNPILTDIQFYKAVDSYTAYQELMMYISGVMGGKTPKTIELSNEVKIAKAGFDKLSFRKEKEEKNDGMGSKKRKKRRKAAKQSGKKTTQEG